MIGLLNSDLHSGDAPLGLLKTFLFFSIVLVLISEEIDLISYINKVSVILALVTIAMAVMNLVSPELFLGVSLFIADKGNGVISPSRNLFGLGIGELYYGACPIMIFPFSYYCDQTSQNGIRKFSSALMCSLFGVALLLSGARADILATLSIALIFTMRYVRRVSGWVPALTVGAIVVILAAVTVIPNFADKQEGSNAVKLKHISSYNEEFGSKPAVLLSGEGANSAFYSEGFEMWTTVTEVTYLELVRVFGLPMTILFGAGLLWIGYHLFANGLFSIGLAYFAFLGIAGTNPLLVGSTGFLVIAAMYERAVRYPDPLLPPHAHFRLWGPALPNRLRL
jgi:MFS family permease